MIQNTPEQLANRHIAKLINKIKPLNVPEIVNDAIRTEMFYLMKDLISLSDNNKFKENFVGKTNR